MSVDVLHDGFADDLVDGRFAVEDEFESGLAEGGDALGLKPMQLFGRQATAATSQKAMDVKYILDPDRYPEKRGAVIFLGKTLEELLSLIVRPVSQGNCVSD